MKNLRPDEKEMDTERLNRIFEPLLAWFLENARVLPWRETPVWGDRRRSALPRAKEDAGMRPASPGDRAYRVWVSEIMLQQTRVEAVKPYYRRFMEALPDVLSLAECPGDRLLKLWEGLGYYSRVRNMQKAAGIVMERYGGRLPEDYEELLGLPGIGSYTAGAVASIAYGKMVPAVDGNVLRVVSRITGNRGDISRQPVKRRFEALLQDVMIRKCGGDTAAASCGAEPVSEYEDKPLGSYFPGDEPGFNLPGTFNQSLMELGAIVCLPGGAPDCGNCPVKSICYANETSCQMELPVKAPKKERRMEKRTVLVIRDSVHGAVRRRSERGLLAGLYELPNAEGWLSSGEALDVVKKWGFSPIRITSLPEAKHIFSHIEWRMIGYLILVEDVDRTPGNSAAEGETEFPGNSEADRGTGSSEILFIEPSRTEREYPIPAAFAAYTKYLSIRLGQEKYAQIQETEKEREKKRE